MAKKANDQAEISTARDALEVLNRVCDEWLNVISTAATSDARAVIPAISMDLGEFIGAAVQGVPTGTLPPCEFGSYCKWEELQDAAIAITLDEESWDDWMLNSAARTLFKAAERKRAKAKAPTSPTVSVVG